MVLSIKQITGRLWEQKNQDKIVILSKKKYYGRAEARFRKRKGGEI